MIAAFREMLELQRRRQAAVGAFTCYDATTAIGVVRAAEAASTPVVLLVSAASFGADGGDLLVGALRAVADRAAVPVCVQLDHVDDRKMIERALELGVGAVMADGSRLPYSENVAFVRDIVELAHESGAGVEAELGHIEGGEDVAYAVAAAALTDPEEAHAFVQDGRPDCLAVSIGNVHGTYLAPPSLDWTRLEAIRTTVEVPLSLHGASGLPPADIRRAVSYGVSKVNVNAELRRRTIAELERRLPDVRDGYRVFELVGAVEAAIGDVVRETLETLDSA